MIARTIRASFQAPLLTVLLLGAGAAIGGLWLLYAVYETGMHERWLCSGECNIRIDLLAIYPALLVGSLAAGISLLRGPRRPQPPA